jgi:hypothetical protein
MCGCTYTDTVINSLKGKKPLFPISSLALSTALFTANNAEQLKHIGGSPTPIKQYSTLHNYGVQ